MEESLRQWLDRDDMPEDFFELIGVQRFHPDRNELLQAIRKVSRFLLLCQNHQEPKLAQRARRLQMLLGEADRVFSEDGRWQLYEQELLQQMRQAYMEGAGNDASTWQPANLRRWLEIVKNVHPGRLDELTASLISPPGKTATAPARKDVEIVEVDEPSADETALRPIPPFAPATVNPLTRSVDPPGDSFAIPSIQTTGLPAQHLDTEGPQSAGPQSPPPQPPARPSAPPARSTPPVLKSADRPPVPGPDPIGDRGPTRAAHPPQLPGQQESTLNSDLLWIVGSAIVTALALGAICMAILLPSLLRSRPRVDPSQTDLQEQPPSNLPSPRLLVTPPASEREQPSSPPTRSLEAFDAPSADDES